MAGGLAALLDDVAVLARAAAASADDIALASGRASIKAAGVVVDDAAVTPQYVRGLQPARELPIVWKIALGSLRNKLVIILPAALLLSQFAPWLLTPILMIGGTFLCYEGAEKIWELISGHHPETSSVQQGADAEKRIVSGAVRTDLILSAEIMVISLNEVASAPLLQRAAILVVVGIAMTAVVYGAVALLVKMDDVGLAMTRRDSPSAQRTGRRIVVAMPHVMTVISYVGMVAMLWVGGHIVLVGLDELGAHYPYAWVHHLEEAAAHVPAVGGALAWLAGTACSTVFGALWGAVVVLVVSVLPFGKKHGATGAGHDADGHRTEATASATSATASAPGTIAPSGPRTAPGAAPRDDPEPRQGPSA
ncbi:DUF808 domain-containing protein [Brachybacterium sp. AOP25-B2-12]|uniref:DUF808 domain-containing protein n=1 Tax=Brachybacterium sp. AOP25-B2-12 TaxID=3457710 RepID=UPI004033D71C